MVRRSGCDRRERSKQFLSGCARAPIMMEDMSNSDPELRHIFFKDANALQCAVAGHNHAAISHELCDVTCLPARRRARIEDSFSRLRIEKLASDRRARILNIAMTPLERFGWKCVQLNEVRIVQHRARFRISPQELFAIDFQSVDPGIQM